MIMLKNSENHEARARQRVFHNLTGLQVLVIDDNADFRYLMTLILEDYGVTVMTAASANQAIETIQKFTIDLLIIDVVMPNEDGFSLIRRIRTLMIPEKRSIPAIALTALDIDAGHILALVSGFHIYLNKPVEFTTLVENIAKLVNKCTCCR
ncbi:response regulator [Scytonema sp. UIC 10036]|uniref:response regulator n=1 Tax=Scytonema sp. UIC 10036 TaxID=2304196 RepID=UPI0012DAA2B8|nr:response regulator [Scytonema sp. UIC 10036]MUG98818.1 response regulator [Scytonema sp. UIC 10036]